VVAFAPYQAAPPEDPIAPEHSKPVIRAFVAAINAQDWGKLDELRPELPDGPR
jgi:hypothetical protein